MRALARARAPMLFPLAASKGGSPGALDRKVFGVLGYQCHARFFIGTWRMNQSHQRGAKGTLASSNATRGKAACCIADIPYRVDWHKRFPSPFAAFSTRSASVRSR
ncbi:MAG: hypothetical protein ORN29_01990 [Rhodoferax sp.]|nr:hypothetical protein [Rhodoferax sp.]